MSTLKISNKKINYSEDLTSNVYTVRFDYTKPANAHNEAQTMRGEYVFCINFDEKMRYDGKTKNLGGWGRLNLNGKNLSTSEYLRNVNGTISLGVSVTGYEYNTFNNLTKADAEVIFKIISEIVKTSNLFTVANLTERAEAFEMLSNLKQAIKNVNELEAKLKEAKEQAAATLKLYKVTEEQASIMVQLHGEGVPVNGLKEAVQSLTRLASPRSLVLK